MSVRLRRNNDGRFRESAHGVNQNENLVSVSERLRHAFLPAAVSVQKIDLARLRGRTPRGLFLRRREAEERTRRRLREPRPAGGRSRRTFPESTWTPRCVEELPRDRFLPQVPWHSGGDDVLDSPNRRESLYGCRNAGSPVDGPTRSGKPSPAPVVFLAPDRCLGCR